MTHLRRLEALPRAEALQLLRSVSLGRLVFTQQALPAIRPVNHIVDGDRIVVRVYQGTAISRGAAAPGGMVVAYEADLIDTADRLGWSVIVVGRATLVLDEAESARYREQLEPWVSGGLDDVIAIQAEIVDGFRLVSGTDASSAEPSRVAASPGQPAA